MKRKLEFEFEFKLTPRELAEEFCNLYDDEQAEFFNEIANITNKWDKPFCFQLQSMVNTNILTDDAKYIMSQIGDYSE